jgi:antitoxin ParD1/3/4
MPYGSVNWSPVVPTRNVVLTQQQTELIKKLVDSGRYQNASEVLRDGLRLVESREAEDRARLKALRDAARVGLADAEAGRYRTFDTPSSFRHHLDGLAKSVIGGRTARSRRS